MGILSTLRNRKGNFAAVISNLRRMRGRISDVIGNNPVLYFLAGFVVVGFVFLNLRRRYAVGTDALLVEVFGFLLDIMLFGVLLSLYDKWRERRTKIRHYHDELIDFGSWEGQEGVLRKVGIIRRLNEMHAPLPSMGRIVLNRAKLAQATLEGANLEGANLRLADLWDANFRGANLRTADLWGANFRGAALVGADLVGADLGRAALWRANLRGANLWKANLAEATLEGAYLEGAKLKGADLWGANLDEAKGLTWAQLKEARLDDKTVLPDYLKQEEESKKTEMEEEKDEGKK